MDVFVAYSSKDESRVRTIVEWLRRNGLNVWVAYELPAGLDWDTEIDRVLADIPCVLAVWSPNAVASAEVKGEARAAMARETLVTISLDQALPPRSFTHLHTVDLTGLSIEEDSPRTTQALDGIRSKLSASDPARDESAAATVQPPASSVARGGNRLWLGGGVAALAIAAFALLNGQGHAQPSCDEEGVYILAGQTFTTDTVLTEPLVCIAANADVKVKNGARLDIETESLILEGPARFDGRGESGAPGRAGSNGPVHHHEPPKVGVIAICGNAPSRADYSGGNGGSGGRGGDGARISVRYRQLQGDLASLKHDVSGGVGGAGGAGGRPGRATCKVIKPYNVTGNTGRPGTRGAKGKAGSFELVQIEG